MSDCDVRVVESQNPELKIWWVVRALKIELTEQYICAAIFYESAKVMRG
jgi:hypothetical protein